jgi:hypothetical protein
MLETPLLASPMQVNWDPEMAMAGIPLLGSPMQVNWDPESLMLEAPLLGNPMQETWDSEMVGLLSVTLSVTFSSKWMVTFSSLHIFIQILESLNSPLAN